MQILNSGSFINTDNQEKIEQLKFTAQQIANATAEKDGFVIEEEASKKLALEFWEGLEYMCRDAEEAAIKNIFLSHFLERLRELRPSEKIAKSELPNDSKAKDEFLGVLAETVEEEDDETIIAEEAKAIMEEGSRRTIDFPASDKDSAGNEESDTTEIVTSEPNESPEILAKEKSETDEPDVDEKSQKKSVSEVIHLPEKEPYKWDKCLVTATIQLLPAESEKRRAVLSVRTHDFAPQISVHEITGEVSSENLLSALDMAFEKYKTDLPVKVMDKLKREADGVKKKRRKTPAKPVTNEQSPKKSSDNKTETKTEVKTSESQKVLIPKPDTSIQGNLFG